MILWPSRMSPQCKNGQIFLSLCIFGSLPQITHTHMQGNLIPIKDWVLTLIQVIQMVPFPELTEYLSIPPVHKFYTTVFLSGLWIWTLLEMITLVTAACWVISSCSELNMSIDKYVNWTFQWVMKQHVKNTFTTFSHHRQLI